MPATTPILGLPYPVGADTADVPRDIKALADKLDPLGHAPVGAVVMWHTPNPPAGWLLENGQQVSAATYPGLAALFGQVGGVVTLPDMRDVFPLGAGATALNGTGGAASVTLTALQSGTRAHSHGGLSGSADRSLTHTHPDEAGNVALVQAGTGASAGIQTGGLSYTTGSTGGAGVDHLHPIAAEAAVPAADAHENRPPFRAVNFIIRAG